MPLVTRRAFLGSLAAVLPVATLVRHAHTAALLGFRSGTDTLRALAEAILPSELGDAELGRVVREFQQWIAGYREGAEVLHGYGTSRLERAGPTPATRWMAQLDALDAAARRSRGSGASLASLSAGERRQLVHRALDDGHAVTRDERIPTVARAPHVALALLGHYYASTEALDRCYGVRIGKQSCRPLATSGRLPLPIAGGRA